MSLAGRALLALLIGCGSTHGAQFPTARELPEEPRKPDGVAVDLQTAAPPAAHADTTTHALVALQEPVDTSLALDVIRSFFQSVAAEDLEGIRKLMAPDASLGPLSSGGGPPAAAQWERRVRRLEYDALGSEPVFRESTVQSYRRRDLDQPMPGRPAAPPGMYAGDVLVRVPIARTRVGVDRLFGDEILFVLRRADRQYRIQAMYEDFQVP